MGCVDDLSSKSGAGVRGYKTGCRYRWSHSVNKLVAVGVLRSRVGYQGGHLLISTLQSFWQTANNVSFNKVMRCWVAAGWHGAATWDS